MNDQPSMLTRLRAAVRGEQSAETLEAFRRAGADAYGALTAAEHARGELAAAGRTPWEATDGERAMLVASWCAFVLQTLADEFLDADYRADAGTVGFVPPVTAEQALAFYGQVEQWLSRAHRAQSDPGYRLDVRLPVGLPPWVEVEPCPVPHLTAMLAASDRIVEHAELAVADLRRAGGGHPEGVARVEAELASARTSADYARGLFSPGCNAEVHERAEQSVKRAIAHAYRVGQLAADPAMADEELPPLAVVPKRLPGPGEPGFDPWCLTDPEARDYWRSDPRARDAIESLWRFDPDPRATLDLQAQLDAAIAAGDLEYATTRSGRRVGNYYCCPWSAIYVARRPLRLGALDVSALQQLTLDVSAEEVLEGGPFVRRVLTGNFVARADVDYCDPRAGGHDD